MPRHFHTAGLLALLAASSAQVLPYNPTRVLLPPYAPYAYVFQASAQGAGQSQLWTLDLTIPLTNAASQLQTVSPTLPFLQDGDLVPYVPAIDTDGNITVIAGNCSSSAGGAQVWRFAAENTESTGPQAWARCKTSAQKLKGGTALAGANFLANGIAFSEVANGDANKTSIFAFGGMCPYANATTDNWTSLAEYSNQLLNFTPDTDAGYAQYDI
ncbi:hypothetical protein LTR53_017067, partial [Teratosphaeriaceae sp. CCFEE 6253]